MDRELIYSVDELKQRMKRYIADLNKQVPTELFAQQCGYSVSLLNKVFVQEYWECQPDLQQRASRLLRQIESGEFAVMRNKAGDRWMARRPEPKPKLKPAMQLVFTPTGIALKVGQRNKNDYSTPRGLFDAAP